MAIAVTALIGAVTAIGFWEYRSIAPLAQRDPAQTSYMRARGSANDSLTQWIPLRNMSPMLICAVVKSEDRGFFRHGGWDVGAMWGAMQRRAAGVPSGHGTTITQQLARNLFLTPRRSLGRKVSELLVARRIEALLSKERILELYLNTSEWGPHIWGVAAASERYFGVAPAHLSLFEASFLSALLPAPTTSPTGQNAERIRGVQRRVLVQLVVSGLLARDEAEAALFAADTWRDSTLDEGWLSQLRRAAQVTHEKPPVSRPSVPSVVATGCGFAREVSYGTRTLEVR